MAKNRPDTIRFKQKVYLAGDDGARFKFEGVFQVVERADDADFTFFGEFGGGGDFWEHGAGFEEALFAVIFGFFGGEVF